MFQLFVLSFLVPLLFAFFPAFAADHPQISCGQDGMFHGGNSGFAGASRDTVFLIGPWGSGAQVNGQFQDPDGQRNWNGWTHYDLTQITESHWHISDYNAADLSSTPNNLAMNCGDESIPACEDPDVDGGYGNSWNEILQFTFTVANPSEPCDVTVSGVFSHNTEPGYDYTTFLFETSGGMITMAAIDGIGVAVPFNHILTYQPQDYLGSGQDQVRFVINVTSDGGWSDADCSYPSNGASQFDDLRVQCSNGNYDHTSDFQDGPGDWESYIPPGVGDFADLWQGLADLDPCHSNLTPQVAFIDDGTKVPGVGPSYCINWCYGPGGYIVNTTGGAAAAHDPDAHLYNIVESPVLNWPGGQYLSGRVDFDVYRHEDLSVDAPGIFYGWDVRSAVDPADLETAHWMRHNNIYYGGPDYVRHSGIISDLLEPGRTVTQIRFRVAELGWVWGWNGDDGYPAPYYDNFRYVAFTYEGPGMYTRDMNTAQDNFPASGALDLTDLASNNVRFDMAMFKNASNEELNIPGDSLICDVVSQRDGGQLVENRLYYIMDRNPVFDSVRNPDWEVTGFADGLPSVRPDGSVIQGKFAYDLPDSGFLFPGDVLHYFFSATDEVGNSDPRTSTIPDNTQGFGNFENPLAYNSSFIVHCLPSVDQQGQTPEILFWNDFANRGGEAEWFTALANLGLKPGEHYDIYHTNAPTSGIGNGLGGRATPALMAGYSTLLYTCGDLGNYTISNGDFNHDPSQDVQLLNDWIEATDVCALFTGDNLASNLAGAGDLTNAFLNDYFNVTLEAQDVRPLINNQMTPLVLPEPDNGVFLKTPGWIAYGGCMGINTFDAVLPGEGAQTLARFTNPSGIADYSYSAATLNYTTDDRIITFPYDFMNIYNDPANPAGDGLAIRTHLLREILEFFLDDALFGTPSDAPAADKFAIRNYPNPFNPSTRFEFNLVRAGHLSLKVFNIRGELVRTLIDEKRDAGTGHIMWNGTNDNGRNVASGIYFFETCSGADILVGKMVLLK